MKLLIEKRSKRKFPPPFTNDGKTAVAVGITVNQADPKKRSAYILENGHLVNCETCRVLQDLDF